MITAARHPPSPLPSTCTRNSAHKHHRIPGAFTKEQADSITVDVWTRLGMDPADKSTWTRERTNMPSHRLFDAGDFAPRAWAAICELCGGEARIDPGTRQWRDGFIVNLGSAEAEAAGAPPPEQLNNWHVDGDFFVHYLDSPEQGLLVVPLFTDIRPGGGGTMICPPAVPHVARWLLEHPEGVSPRMIPRADPDFAREHNEWFKALSRRVAEEHRQKKKDGECFVEVTGKAGDVYLLHPLMLHSATTNPRRDVRIITNPPVSLVEPFRFDREDGDYTLVERTTLRALGREDLRGWRIAAPRERVVPSRIKIQQEMKEAELRRLEEAKRLTAAA